MILTLAQIEILELLVEGKHIASSRLKGDFGRQLLQGNALSTITHGSQKSYAALNKECFIQHLELLGWSDLDALRLLAERKNELSRAEQVRMTGDSKSVRRRTFCGFLVNSYVPIEASLNGLPFMIAPIEGSYLFVSDYELLRIPEDVLVVGLENAENFRRIRQQSYLFKGKRILFVSRYPQNQSDDLINWLKSIPNKYLHFGDFDMFGIRIYLTEFFQKLGPDKSSFFIPEDIEARISQSGNAALYNQQYLDTRNLIISDPRVQPLVDIIRKYHKVYEQEGYII